MSIHETWEADLDSYFCEPGVLEVYADLRRRMIAKEFEPVTAVVTQPWRGSFNLYEAYAFGQIYAGLRTGEITLTPILLGADPDGDDQLEKNQAKLARLESPFKAVLRKGRGDDDGEFSWTESIFLGDTELPSQRVPLEIGYTRPLTTLWHLHHERGLARWPYGHDRVWLLMKHGRIKLRS
jgi:hypothetical protein